MAPTTSQSWSMLMPATVTSAAIRTTVSKFRVPSVYSFSMLRLVEVMMSRHYPSEKVRVNRLVCTMVCWNVPLG